MRYFKLLLDDSNENDVVGHCNNTHGYEQYELSNGKFIQDWNTDITFVFNPSEGDRLTDYLANNLGWFIVSTRFKEVLCDLDEDGVQYLPVKVVNSEDNTVLNNYYVANVINVVDAINFNHSDYSVISLDNEKIYSIRKYALDKNEINMNHLFKLKGLEIPLFVSESVEKLVTKNNITGCDFLEVKVI
ncbi:imm11 family protein [Pseudalkalibacillus sp. SCS-8]|uniref:imm11 family protein n=1 Tax=Pseudalkalibacillus nanhaiensis TaxID=3115291 RepID=UPI0032DAC2A9